MSDDKAPRSASAARSPEERALWLADKLVGDYGSEAAQLLRHFATRSSTEPTTLLKEAAGILSKKFVDAFPEEHPEVMAWFMKYDAIKNAPVSASEGPVLEAQEIIGRWNHALEMAAVAVESMRTRHDHRDNKREDAHYEAAAARIRSMMVTTDRRAEKP